MNDGIWKLWLFWKLKRLFVYLFTYFWFDLFYLLGLCYVMISCISQKTLTIITCENILLLVYLMDKLDLEKPHFVMFWILDSVCCWHLFHNCRVMQQGSLPNRDLSLGSWQSYPKKRYFFQFLHAQHIASYISVYEHIIF